MIPTHWVRLRAAVHATERREAVEAALHRVAGLDEPGEVTATEMESHHGAPLWMLELTLRRRPEIRRAQEAAFDAIGRDMLLSTLEARVDDAGILYLRFDKQAASQGNLCPGEGGDVVQAMWKIEAHPAGRERALATARATLSA